MKDTFNTATDFQVNTTCGSYAFIDSRPRGNAPVVQKAIGAGMVVIAKANISGLGYFKGPSLVRGWSAVGGQAQSPYFHGDVDKSEGTAGHSNPAGSSTGCGSAVAAGDSTKTLRTQHVERLLHEHSADLILGPADSLLPDIVGFSGITSATLFLSYLGENGRPFGLLAVAGRYQEELLIMRLWEVTFPRRRVPTKF